MNECKKKKKRSFFDLFAIYSCDNCSYYNQDYYFYLGMKKIDVYFLIECCLDEVDLLYNMKILYILNEVNNTSKEFFWFYSYEDFENLFGVISEIDNDIIVVIEK